MGAIILPLFFFLCESCCLILRDNSLQSFEETEMYLNLTIMTCRSNYKRTRWIPWWRWWLPPWHVGMWTGYDRTLESFSLWCVLLQIFGHTLLQYVSMARTATAAVHIGKNARKSSKHLNSVVLGLFRWRATKWNLTISAHHLYVFYLNRKAKCGRTAWQQGWATQCC